MQIQQFLQTVIFTELVRISIKPLAHILNNFWFRSGEFASFPNDLPNFVNWRKKSQKGSSQRLASLAKVYAKYVDRLCGLVVRVFGYRSGGPGSIPGTTRKKIVGLERGPLSLVSTTEKLLDRKVAAPV
jgi:hypothetical protein